MLVLAIALAYPAAMSVLSAVKAERSGSVLYSAGSRVAASEQVTRGSSPAKFQQAVAMHWFRAVALGSVAGVAFYFFRRLRE